MAKGFVLEVLQMAIIAVLTVSVLYFWFSGQGKVEPAPINYVQVECKTHVDCTGNPEGPDCLTVYDSPTFCGCLDDTECGTGKCVEDRCVS